MLFNLFIVLIYVTIISAFMLVGALISYMIDKYKEYKLHQGIESFSCEVMTKEETSKWFESLRR